MKTRISRLMVAGFCLLPALLSSGCAGMLVRAIATKSTSYTEVSAKAGPIAGDQSRVWIYMVGGSPNAWNTAGTMDNISFNKKIYNTGGNAFFYADVPSGSCRVSTTIILGKQWKPGKIQQRVTLEAGKEYFIKVRLVGKECPFDFVERAEAASGMQSLKYWTPAGQKCGKDLDE